MGFSLLNRLPNSGQNKNGGSHMFPAFWKEHLHTRIVDNCWFHSYRNIPFKSPCLNVKSSEIPISLMMRPTTIQQLNCEITNFDGWIGWIIFCGWSFFWWGQDPTLVLKPHMGWSGPLRAPSSPSGRLRSSSLLGCGFVKATADGGYTSYGW